MKAGMKLRSEQMSRLNDAIEASYRRDLIRFLREEMPQETQERADAYLEELIEAADQRARSFGITDAAPFAQFTVICLAAGLDFFKYPAIADVLERTDMDQESKMVALIQALDPLDTA